LEESPGGIDSAIASIRYRALIPAHALAARGHQTSVIGLDRGCFDRVCDQIAAADCVVFRKNYHDAETTERMLREARTQNVKTVFDVSDDRFLGKSGDHLRCMVAQAGSIVTASTNLREIVRQHTNRESLVVGDPFEGARSEARWSPHGARLKALWFGHGVNVHSLRGAFPALLQVGRSCPLDLRIVTRDPGLERECKQFNSKYRNHLSLRYVEWSLKEMASSLAATDFVVIPALPEVGWTLAKSPNRIIESLWAGRFVVAHPIPSYMEFKDWAWIGADLTEGIAWMIANGAVIADRVRTAQDHIAATYSPQRIGLEWEKVLETA
jgi:hypothetical protein